MAAMPHCQHHRIDDIRVINVCWTAWNLNSEANITISPRLRFHLSMKVVKNEGVKSRLADVDMLTRPLHHFMSLHDEAISSPATIVAVCLLFTTPKHDLIGYPYARSK
jgi:hypothetical protein